LSSAVASEEVIMADLDLVEAYDMRDNIPCWKQKRNDVYDILEK
jgi:predicted amidohydrolase